MKTSLVENGCKVVSPSSQLIGLSAWTDDKHILFFLKFKPAYLGWTGAICVLFVLDGFEKESEAEIDLGLSVLYFILDKKLLTFNLKSMQC
jgi:hypothetical protein